MYKFLNWFIETRFSLIFAIAIMILGVANWPIYIEAAIVFFLAFLDGYIGQIRDKRKSGLNSKEISVSVPDLLSLESDKRRIDWLEEKIKEGGCVWICPSGEELRYVQIRNARTQCDNFETVPGIRAAIDEGIAGRVRPRDF